jgi:hypothetical protein
MAEAKEAWGEVGARLGTLGERLKQHFGSAGTGPDEGAPEQAGEPLVTDRTFTATGESASATTDEPDETPADALKEALRNLSGALRTTVDAIGAAAKDRELTSEAREAGQAFVNAMAATFSSASDDVRRAFNRGDDRPDGPNDQDGDGGATGE